MPEISKERYLPLSPDNRTLAEFLLARSVRRYHTPPASLLDEDYDLFIQMLELWCGLPLNLSIIGYLGSVTIETLLLQIESQKLTGHLELEHLRRRTRLTFQHGFLVGLEGELYTRNPRHRKRALRTRIEPHESTSWRSGELLQQLLGWRSGSYHFQPADQVETQSGFPIRTGQLLSLAWLLILEQQGRFQRKLHFFDRFIEDESRSLADLFFRKILDARRMQKSGVLKATGRGGELTLQFVNGEIQNVRNGNEGNQLGDLCLRYHLISRTDFMRLTDRRKRQHATLIEVAFEEGLLDEQKLQLLFALRLWERTFECCHWPYLAVEWKEENPLIRGVYGSKLPGRMPDVARCPSCGEYLGATSHVCQALSRSPEKRRWITTPSFTLSTPLKNLSTGVVLITLAAISLYWYSTSAFRTPSTPVRASLMNVSQTDRKPTVFHLRTEDGTVRIERTQIQSLSLHPSGDQIQIQTRHRTFNIPQTELEKFSGPEKKLMEVWLARSQKR